MPDDLTVPAVQLRRDGVSLLLLAQEASLPAVAHWGADLGPLTAAEIGEVALVTQRQAVAGMPDTPWRVPAMPLEGDGWHGRPGLQLRRGGTLVHPRWSGVTLAGTETTTTVTADADGLHLRLVYEIAAGGLVSASARVTNTGTEPLEVDWLELTMPVPRTATTVTDFGGRWTREKEPQTRALAHGSVVRQTRHGKGGHEAAWLTALSDGEPRNRRGEIGAVHLAWSGDVTHRTDRLAEDTTLLGAGELLRPGELVLAGGESYSTPAVLFAHSTAGWDGVSARFHAYVRAGRTPPRMPLLLNTWEAVYFAETEPRLDALADEAAGHGIERLVVDDGWFLGRRDDGHGLGDWEVDRGVFPHGLEPVSARAHELGLEFGLWFEPEMVDPVSELGQAHPDWLLHHRPLAAPPGITWRHQHVLDLADPAAYASVLEHISGLVAGLGIDYIKWDHNRDLVEAEHAGRPGVHTQVEATWRLIRELKTAHPGLEIESCSSGGARTDLGILALTDRVWASDSNDAIERQRIQRWTQLLVPPEYVGSHVGPSPVHNTGRVLDLPFRLTTALMGSAGFETDVTAMSEGELELVHRFADLYRSVRPLIAIATVVHADLADPALTSTGFVSPDQGEALYTVAAMATLADAEVERLPLLGLEPDATYAVSRVDLGPVQMARWQPVWLTQEVQLTGRVLETIGLQLPALWPGQALVIRVRRSGLSG